MERSNRNHLIAIIIALFFALSAFASPLGTTYQARIVKPDGLALESANVNFKFTILNPAGTCILYAETFSAISMANSSGMISFTLGSGVKTYPASATTFAQVFNNSTPSLSCDAGGPVSYSPIATDIRKIVMQFNDGNGWQTLPAMAINAVPYAIYSNDSLSLGGVSATSYVQYSTIPTCATSEALRYNGTSFNCVSVASGGGGASYTVTSSDVTSALGYTPANQSSVATSFTTVSNSLSTVGTSFTTVTSTINSLGSSVTAVTTSVSSLSSSFTALTSTVSGLSASLAALTSSQWSANGSDIYYSSGSVGVGTSAPATKFAVGDSLTKPSAVLMNVTSATTAEFNAIQTLTSGQTGAVTINSVAAPGANSTAVDAGLTVDLRVEASQTANVGSRIGITSLNSHNGTGAIAEMYGQVNVVANSNGGTVAGLGGSASILQNVSGTVSNFFGEMLNVTNMSSGNTSLMTGTLGTVQNVGTAGNMAGIDYTLTNSKQVTNMNGLVTRITNEASATKIVGVYSEIKNTVNSVANAQSIYGLYSHIENHSNATVANVYGLYLDKYMTTAASANDYGIYQRDASKNYFAGRIGIGTSSPVTALDVVGGVRIGTESAGCAASLAGTLRYTAGNVEYCNGTSWQAFGVGGATTSSSIVAALGYTPANSSTVAASMTAVTNSVATNSSSITALTSTVNTHTSSLTALAASMSAVTSSQWVTSGTNIYYNSGHVGVGTNTPIQKLDVSGVALVSGEYGAGETLAVSGSGSRMFFYPRKAAFRAGSVGADEWDEINIGDASIALGDSPIASGYGTVALGVGSVASGPYSVAIGRYSQALGQGATAFGESTATGDLSTAFDSSSADGLYSIAMGSSSANADRSISIGQNSNANGLGSIAIGGHINANAMNVVAVGSYNVGNGSGTAWLATDPIFEVGNSQNGSPRSNAMTILKNGNVGVGVLSPAAILHLAAGTSVTASLKLSSGALLTTPQAGAVEYDGSNLYYTDGTNVRRSIATANASGVVTNVSSIQNLSGNIDLVPNTTGSVVVSATTASTNSQTGALIVKGGVGVTGNINSSGTIITSSNIQGTSITATSGMIAPYIAGSTASGGAIRIDSTTHASKGNILLAPNGGNIGIGVSNTAEARLHISAISTAATSDTYHLRIDGVDGVNGAEPTFKIGFCQDSLGGYGATCFKSTDPATGVGAQYVFKGEAAAADIKFDGGNIGIGNSSPAFPLDIWSSNAFQARILHASNSAGNDAAIMMVRQRGTASAGSAVLNNDSIGGMYFRAHDGVDTSTSTAHIEVAAGENQTATNKGSVMTFATTQNGQAARQEIMRIHSNGFVGIGNTSPNALLQVGPSGPQGTNYNIYVASYKNNAGQGQYVGNWASNDYWALGPATNSTDKTLRLGIASDRTGTWSGTQDLNLAIGGNVNVGGTLNVSGAVYSALDLIPASATLLMESCPTGWTDTGATGGGPGAATCNGVTCRMCQTANAALVPASTNILMDSCPSGWSTLGRGTGPGSAGYQIGGAAQSFLTCQSPAAATIIPKGVRLPMVACPTSWTDLGVTGIGSMMANCPSSSCRVCESPSGMTNLRFLYGGNTSGTLYGADVTVLGGRGGTTSGPAGGVSIRGGIPYDGSGGSVVIQGGSAVTSTSTPQVGGDIQMIAGNGVVSGAGGSVIISAGNSPLTSTYSTVFLNPYGGNVGIGTGITTAGARLQVQDSGGATEQTIGLNSSGSGVNREIAYTTNNVLRWVVGVDNAAESGGADGSDFYVNSYDDAGTYLSTGLFIKRSSGNVGLGSVSPLKALHIQKDQNADTALLIRNLSSGTAAISALDIEAETNGVQLIAYSTTATGNWTGNTVSRTNTAALRTYTTLPVSHMLVGTGSTAPLHLMTNDTPRLTVTSAGAVGIGTLSPTTNLHVANTSTVTNPVATLESTGAGGRPYLKFRAENTDYGYVGFGSTGNATMALMNYQAGPLYLGTSSTARMVIDSTGSFAVGGIFAPAGQMANTSINLGDGGTIAATAGSGIGPGGLSWQATAGGYTGNFFNSGSASNANGLQVYTASVDAATYILNVRSNGSSRMVVKGDGRVGIGNASPAAALDVTGDIRGTGTVATWSDQRAKKNITTIPDSLNRVLKLRGVNFDWRTDEFPDKKFKTTRDMGVIAQEVEKVFPEAVNTSSDSFKSVSYSLLVAPLIEAVKELYYKITGVEHKVDRAVASVEQKADKSEVDALKAENAELKKRLDRLEKLMLENQKSK